MEEPAAWTVSLYPSVRPTLLNDGLGFLKKLLKTLDLLFSRQKVSGGTVTSSIPAPEGKRPLGSKPVNP